MLSFFKRNARRILSSVDALAIRAAVRVKYLSNVYYCFNREFEREHHGVLTGRLRYQSGENGLSDTGHLYRLRRNTHRLEKGLIMRPRREVFARDYLAETVESFVSLYGDSCKRREDELFAWSDSVLRSYFDAVAEGLDKEIDASRRSFFAATNQTPAAPPAHSPYQRETTPLQVTIEGVLELAKRRRSVRWYDQRKVPRDVIDAAITVAGYSPSACNRQPFEFRIFDDPEMVAELATTPLGTGGFNHQFPVFVVIVGVLHAYPKERDRHLIYIDGSLAAMAFQFALESQGVASCSINWPDIADRERMMARLLGLRPDERVVMCLSLGYPDPTGLVPYSQKKSLDELRSFNRMVGR